MISGSSGASPAMRTARSTVRRSAASSNTFDDTDGDLSRSSTAPGAKSLTAQTEQRRSVFRSLEFRAWRSL